MLTTALNARNRKVTLTILWMTILPLLSSTVLTIVFIQSEIFFERLVVWQWIMVYAAASITMAFAITPTTFVAIVSGYFLGYSGVAFLIISYQLASVIGYFVARKVDEGSLKEITAYYPGAQNFIDKIHRNQYKITFLSRISPVLPFALMNVVLSVSGIRFQQFFIGGLIGMLPRSLFFVWVGIEASKLTDALENNEHAIWTILLTLLAGVGLFLIFRKKT